MPGTLGNLDSNQDCQGQNLVGCQLPHTPSEWATRELNPHVRRHRDLNPARLPVSPAARQDQGTYHGGLGSAIAYPPL
jgi:hypothetical protein